MTMIVDTECEEGKEVPGGGAGGVEGVNGGGVGGGGGGRGGRGDEPIKLEPGLIWPPHHPPPQYLPPKTEIKVILKMYESIISEFLSHALLNY